MKRFTDTEKWRKKWWRNLSDKAKVFWIYILDTCNNAGIWEVDWELAKFFCGDFDENKITQEIEKQIEILQNGKKWLIKDFICFQYGSLTENNNFHRSIRQLLQKDKKIEIEGQTRGSLAPMEKEKDKDNKNRIIDNILLRKSEKFRNVWEHYLEMRKKIRKPATEHAKELLLKKIEKMYPDEEKQIKVLEQSIENSWQGLFEIKTKKKEEVKDGKYKDIGITIGSDDDVS